MLLFLIFLIWTYAAPCHPAHSLSSSFKCFLVILQALSLSAKITKLPSDSPGSLSLFLTKVTKLLTQQTQITHATQLQHTLTCSSVVVTYFSTLTTTARNPIAYIYQIYHTAMGHRYFNLAVSCGICLRYAHASHKSASAFRFPIL